MHDRVVSKVPGMGMGWIDPAERGEELPAFQLQAERQVRCLHKCLLDLDVGFVVVVEFEDDVGKTFEIRIDRAIECKLDIASVESALLRIVIAHFDMRKIACTRPGKSKHPVEGNVHVVFATTSNRYRLGE